MARTSEGGSHSAAATRPLDGKCIVVTRAPEQPGEFARELQRAGAQVLFLPLVRFLEPEDATSLDAAIHSIGDFDWIIFTSANAARFFVRRCARDAKLRTESGRPFTGDAKLRMKIAAVGLVTKQAVEAEGLRVDLMPEESNGEALAKALAALVRGKKVCLPRSDLAARDLPDALRAAGALLTEVVAYRTAEPDDLDPVVMAAMEGGVDAVTFFSPSAFHHFGRALGEPALRKVSARTAFAAVGPVTASAIRKAGFEVAVEAAEPSGSALITALEAYFAARKGPAILKAAKEAH